jgi:TetR/AcrR family transcriptional regulator
MVKSSSQSRDGDTEQRILDAAHEVFLRRGTAGARMQEIAKEADVNPALLHYYFRTKEREAKVEQVVDVELQQLQTTPYLPGYILSELTHHPERIRQLFSSVTGVTPTEIGKRVFKVLGAQIDARVKAGRMHPIAPEQFAINLLALCVFPFAARPMVMALAGLDQAGFNQFIERRRRELAPFFLRALRP